MFPGFFRLEKQIPLLERDLPVLLQNAIMRLLFCGVLRNPIIQGLPAT
jgi:hypothetical protein